MTQCVAPCAEVLEIELLLLCTRPVLSAAATARIAELARGEIDWEFLIDEAQEQGVVQLLYPALKAAALQAVPKATMGRLHSLHVDNAGRCLMLVGELRRLLGKLAARNIRALPIKGPVLADFAYGSLTARKAGDLDILIPRDCAEGAEELLTSLGYRPDISPSEAAMTGIHHVSLVQRESNINVELHWSLNPQHFYFPLCFNDLWPRHQAGPAELNGSWRLSAEDTLVYLCSHGARHGWRHLLWVADIANLIHRQRQLDWQIVLQRAQEIRGVRMLNLGLALASELLDTKLPPQIASMIARDRAAKNLASKVARSMFEPPPALLTRLRFVAATRESLRDRLRFFRYAAQRILRPSSADREVAKLPAVFELAYYLLRPVRLLTSGTDRSNEVSTIDPNTTESTNSLGRNS